MSRFYHGHLDVLGALRWSDKLKTGLLKDNLTGASLSPREVDDALLDALNEGKEVLPLTAEPCEGFDWKFGCVGHSKAEDLCQKR